MNDCKTVIIGLDGVPFEMIETFCKMGVMPWTRRLIEHGVFKKMSSTIPEISSVAWSSMITGKNPGEHGIFGFMDLFENSYNTRFPNFSDLKSPPFWEECNGSSVIMNVPSTYPVREMNGVHISGFVSIDMSRSVYPHGFLEKLVEMDYRLDVDSQKAHISMELFLSDMDKTLNARIATYRYLWDNTDWRNFMLVFTGTDRLMHFLWDAYEDSSHKYHNYFLDHFNKIDGVIGEICSRLSDDDLVVIHSDHGFERLDKDIYVNYVLKEQGFLRFKDGHDAAIKNMSSDTKAFALDPSRIYLNLKGKYPRGCVEPEEIDGILQELEDIFRQLETEGRRIIRDIYRKDEIYSGAHFERAPDLVLVAEAGFNLKANVKMETLSDKVIFTGKHTQDTAFLILRGLKDESLVPDVPLISDIRSIIENNSSVREPAGIS